MIGLHVGRSLRSAALALCAAAMLISFDVAAQEAAPSQHIEQGAKLYAANCAVCHGTDMVEESGGFFDLRTFPPSQRARFMASVGNGKNSMPPWKNVLSQQEIAALFAYVAAGQKGGAAPANEGQGRTDQKIEIRSGAT